MGLIRNKKKNKEKYSSFEVTFLCSMTMILGVLLGVTYCYCRSNILDSSDSKLKEIISTYNNILDSAYGKVNKDDLANAAISGMINSLDDPYSSYYTEEETKSFKESIGGYYEGLGITIIKQDDKSIKVAKVMNNSPAAKAGIKVDDIIVSIDKKIAEKEDPQSLADYVSKCKNNTITIKIIRNKKELEFKIKRAKVELDSVESKTFGSIGYLSVSSFSLNTGKQFNNKLAGLKKKGIKSLIIDLRNNPGGHLGQVKVIAEPFFKKNVVLYQVQDQKRVTKTKTSDNESMDIPVVILINAQSASASEILASAFSENYKNATLVGKMTYGKGTIQKDVNLSTGASIKYTTQKWLTSKGVWFNHDENKGLKPDIEIDYCKDSKCEMDMQLEKAKELLKEE